MRSVLTTLVEICGLGAVVYGCWLFFEPLAWIVGGLAGVALANAVDRS